MAPIFHHLFHLILKSIILNKISQCSQFNLYSIGSFSHDDVDVDVPSMSTATTKPLKIFSFRILLSSKEKNIYVVHFLPLGKFS